MISPQITRRYPFFAGLTHDQIYNLSTIANEQTVAPGHTFFREGEQLDKLYFVLDGTINIVVSVPDQNELHEKADQILGNLVTEDITVSTLGPGEIFAWSALIRPYMATAGATAATSSRVIAFERKDLNEKFRDDISLGFLMLEKVAGVIRLRLRDMHIQSLAFVPA
jgi:CRP-like cAMP-binding protein